MEYYETIKLIHITTAILSLMGFVIRGWWMIQESPLLQAKAVKIFPHINDTLLLSAAIYLSVVSGMYPFIVPWLGAKVILLIGYIVAGTIALKRGKTKKIRIVFFGIALACVSLIFVSAILKSIGGTI